MIASTFLGLAMMGQVILPGSNLDLKQAEEKAHVIVVAEAVGPVFLVGVGAVSFGTFEFRPSATLKGEVKDVDMKRLATSASGHETHPEKGHEYVVFIEKYQKSCTIVKLLPRTDANIEAAKKAIQAGRKP